MLDDADDGEESNAALLSAAREDAVAEAYAGVKRAEAAVASNARVTSASREMRDDAQYLLDSAAMLTTPMGLERGGGSNSASGSSATANAN